MRTAVVFAGFLAMADAFAPSSISMGLSSRNIKPPALGVSARPIARSGLSLGSAINSKIGKDVTALKASTSEPSPGTVSALVVQAKKLATASPSLAAFVVLNLLMTRAIKQAGLSSMPPPLVGMFAMFGTLLALPDDASDKVVSFFKPAVDMITRFLPLFFVPALIALPLSASGVAGVDAAKGLAAILAGLVGCYASTAVVTVGLQKISPPPPAVEAAAGGSLPGFSQFLESMFGTFVLLSGLAATRAPQFAPVFMLCTTIFSFVFGSRLPRLLPGWASTVWHPLMSTFVVSTACFSAFAAATGSTHAAVLTSYLIPGGAPLSAAGNAIMYWLGPAIWSFAFGLYARRAILFANLVPIVGGTVWAAVSGIFMMASFNRILGASAVAKLAVLPRATAALAVVQAGMIGASPSLVTAVCVLTGMLGANFGKLVLNGMNIKSPCARGVATGGAAFSLGAAALAKDDPDAFPFGALSMALMSTWATLLYAVPQISGAAVEISGANEKPAVVNMWGKKVPVKNANKVKNAKKVAFVMPSSNTAPSEYL